MRRLFYVMTIVLLLSSYICAQTETATSAAEPAGPSPATPAADVAPAPPAPEVAPEPPADSVAMIVNGKEFMESDIKNLFMKQMGPRMRGRSISQAQIDNMLNMYRGPLLQELLDTYLVEQFINQGDVTVTDEDIDRQLDILVQLELTKQGWTREEFSKMVQENKGQSLDELLAETKKDPRMRQEVYLKKAAEKLHPGDTEATETEAKEYYDKNRESRYSNPEMVRASHILIKIPEGAGEERKAELRKKIEDILTEVKAEGADFAALAAKYSECGSATNGGDLNFFPRHGGMVEPFAEAAFALQPDQISDIVETKFGYHIIKMTDHKDPYTKTFDEVEKAIQLELTMQKQQQQIQALVSELREKAVISFPEGKETTLPFQAQSRAKTQPPVDPEAASADEEPAKDAPSDNIE
ncbi:MAG: peptidylprolyl isomerase [Sedimentisphaerales bacterium]|nr:peptidylprolyl isomerase [Sedimentisphaerales bacterium]